MFRKRWVRRGLITLAVCLGISAVFDFIHRYRTRRAGEERYAAVVAHLDATDPRWRYDEIDADRGTLPDDQNSALLVPKFKATLAQPSFDKDPRLAWDYASSVLPNHVLADDTYDALDAALTANAEALVIARRFGDLPRGVRRYTLAPNPLDTKLTEVQDTRLVCRLLDLAAERAGRDGRGGVALGYVRPMVNTGRSIDGEPSLICTLVRMACLRTATTRVERTLALTTPRGQLSEVQALLLREADSDLFWYGLRGDRAMMDRLFANIRSGRLSLAQIGNQGSGAPDFESRFGAWVLDPYLANDHATFLEIVTRGCEARALPEHQQRAALQQVEREVADLPRSAFGSRLTRLLTPAFTKVHDASLKTKARLRCAAAGVGAERFRRTHGRWPTALDEIPKDILPSVPLDPFDGKPLRYVKGDNGVTIYSIGPDEEDDGGTIRMGKETNDPGQDIGFSLYDPTRRGLPAEPRNRIWFDTGEEDKFGGAPPEAGPEPREVEGK